jgi:hypothetical protein
MISDTFFLREKRKNCCLSRLCRDVTIPIRYWGIGIGGIGMTNTSIGIGIGYCYWYCYIPSPDNATWHNKLTEESAIPKRAAKKEKFNNG